MAHQVKLNWTDSPDEASVNVYHRMQGGTYDLTKPINATPIAKGVQAYTDTTAAAPGVNQYVVCAVLAAGGLTPPSNEASILLGAPPTNLTIDPTQSS